MFIARYCPEGTPDFGMLMLEIGLLVDHSSMGTSFLWAKN